MEDVKVNIKYNEKLLKDFVNFHYKKIFTMFYIIGAILVVLGLLNIAIVSLLSGITLSIFGVFMLFYPLIIKTVNVNTNKRLINFEDEITFSNESMKIVSNLLGEEVSNQEIKYSALEKIIDNARYIYIYVNKTNAHIIDKSQIKEKEYAEILTHISATMEEKQK